MILTCKAGCRMRFTPAATARRDCCCHPCRSPASHWSPLALLFAVCIRGIQRLTKRRRRPYRGVYGANDRAGQLGETGPPQLCSPRDSTAQRGIGRLNERFDGSPRDSRAQRGIQPLNEGFDGSTRDWTAQRGIGRLNKSLAVCVGTSMINDSRVRKRAVVVVQ
jgi:hypothetical protein